MPPQARENRITDLLVTELKKIGIPPTSWLTTPAVAEGIPLDALDENIRQMVYIAPASTSLPGEEDDLTTGGPVGHQAEMRFAVWCVSANSVRDMLNIKADILRALFAGEGVLTAGTDGFGAWPGPFKTLFEMCRAGYYVGVQVVIAHPTLSHADP